MKDYTILEEHYNQHHKKLCQKYAFLTGSPENGEDVVQEGYTRALKYISSFNKQGNFQHWFSRILRNAFLDFKMAEKGKYTEEFDEENFEGTEGPGFFRVFAKQIYKDIDEYPEHLQEILFLYYRNGFSPRDITKITGIKKNTVKQFLHRFRTNVREKHGESMDW